MFDWYVPKPDYLCIECGRGLTNWQGKHANNLLLTWEQGLARPLGNLLLEDHAAQELRLPDQFVFTTRCCAHEYIGYGACIDGIWQRTTIETLPSNTEGVVRALAAKYIGANIPAPTASAQEPYRPQAAENSAADPGRLLQMSAPLREAVDQMTTDGVEILAAVRALSETRQDLFTSPGDRVALLIATSE